MRVVLVEVELTLESLVWPLAAGGCVADVGEVTPGVAGFRAVVDVVVAVRGLDEAAEVAFDRVDVRRAAVLMVEDRRFSSSDPEGWDLWVAVAVEEGRLVAVAVVVGRVGGLLNPPVAAPVRVAELAVGFVAADVLAGRRAVVVAAAGFLAADVVLAGLVPAAEPVFFAGAAAAGEDRGFSAGAADEASGGALAGGRSGVAGAPAGASSCETTS